MSADTIISLVLSEGRKQLASINQKDAPANVARFKRRVKAFRAMKRGGSDTISGSLQKPFSSVPFQSATREMSVKHLLPLLRFHKMNRDNTKEQRLAAKQEYDFHAGIEDRRMNKAIRRTVRKLQGGGFGPTSGMSRDSDRVPYQTSPQDNLSRSWMDPHDAWDHGYTGALPSYHGEVLTVKMGLARKDIPQPDGTKSSLFKQAMTVASNRLPEHMRNIPLEHVLAWSKAIRSKKIRGL